MKTIFSSITEVGKFIPYGKMWERSSMVITGKEKCFIVWPECPAPRVAWCHHVFRAHFTTRHSGVSKLINWKISWIPRDFQSGCQFCNSLSSRCWAVHSCFSLVCCRVQLSPYPFYPDAKKSMFSEACDPSILSICLYAYISSVTDSNKGGSHESLGFCSAVP